MLDCLTISAKSSPAARFFLSRAICPVYPAAETRVFQASLFLARQRGRSPVVGPSPARTLHARTNSSIHSQSEQIEGCYRPKFLLLSHSRLECRNLCKPMRAPIPSKFPYSPLRFSLLYHNVGSLGFGPMRVCVSRGWVQPSQSIANPDTLVFAVGGLGYQRGA